MLLEIKTHTKKAIAFFETQSKFNTWLLELECEEQIHIIQMMEEFHLECLENEEVLSEHKNNSHNS